jgi:hypothetical protein
METDLLGVKELQLAEAREVNGGFVLVTIAALARVAALVGAAIYAYNNAPDFVEGFKEGYQSTQK